VNDAELLDWVKSAAARETAPPELARRVLDTVAYRTRLEAQFTSRRSRRGQALVLVGALALAAGVLLGVKVKAPGGPWGPRIAAEPSAAGSAPARVASANRPQAPDPCVARVVATGSALLTDDFEDADDTLAPLDGRSGFWRWARETDAPGTAPALLPVPRPDAKPHNRLALHVKGAQLFDWGATVEVSFRPPCYDASAYSGISLQARGPGRIFVSVREVDAIPPFEGGTCLQDCYNSHAAKLELGREWRTYQVPWAELHQRGLGKPPLDPSRLHSIALLIHPEDTPYDVWLDEIRFLPPRP
jgi:hypothetical protein